MPNMARVFPPCGGGLEHFSVKWIRFTVKNAAGKEER
ncbi:hypothetical protein MicloDRAFT_00015290 [Microvirga lotononidis]|uniref:Uncharacterized protein n=1 Tax=Microvirga lotononidis TaxID=864069 RepID=I4YYL6_9HYPH|nr:hypothetical protein MicloDRAFT_00015290 [Microvirga lotononidis]